MSFDKIIINHAESLPHQEVCGLVVLGEDNRPSVISVPNISDNIERDFSIPHKSFLKYKSQDRLLGIYHSHHKASEEPSDSDRNQSYEMGVPYLIYSLVSEKFHLHIPTTFKPRKLLGRRYIKGFNDCGSLVMDYYKLECGINVYNSVKNHWWEKSEGANKKLLSGVKMNCTKVKVSEIKKNDLIIFSGIRGEGVHVGVYVGNGFFMHQDIKKLSCREMITDHWSSRIKAVYRMRQLV
jgi:cell wall-associated NlpC family hydrolase